MRLVFSTQSKRLHNGPSEDELQDRTDIIAFINVNSIWNVDERMPCKKLVSIVIDRFNYIFKSIEASIGLKGKIQKIKLVKSRFVF